jgi:hypothetical protein
MTAPPSRAEDLAALSTELATLCARLDALERILQLRDASLEAGFIAPPSHPAPDPTPLPTTFEIAADQLLPAQDGFYQLEWGPEGAFRWTGPAPEVRFEAWIDRSAPLIATLRLFHLGTPANARDLTLEVDGTILPLTRQGAEKVFRSEPIAPRPGGGPTSLTLRVAHTQSPAERGLPDKRILGVAFQRLRLDPA